MKKKQKDRLNCWFVAGGVWCCSYSPDASLLVAGCSKGQLAFYDPASNYDVPSCPFPLSHFDSGPTISPVDSGPTISPVDSGRTISLCPGSFPLSS